jgi:hypothetical protein
LLPATAHAFVCSRVVSPAGCTNSTDTGEGPSLSWFTRDLTYTLQSDGTNQIAGSAEFDTLSDSFSVWQDITIAPNESTSCSNFVGGSDIVFTPTPMSSKRFVGYNRLDPESNENLILFQDLTWPHDTLPRTVIALTTTSFSSVTGEILDADIEFNSLEFDFAIDGRANAMDLKNTAVHEIGHVIGLGHTSVIGSTMYCDARLGDTNKRDLHCDDAAGLVFKYPTGAANHYCSDTVDASCGFCASPETLTSNPTVTQIRKSRGGCLTTSAGWPSIVALLAFLAFRKYRSSHLR